MLNIFVLLTLISAFTMRGLAQTVEVPVRFHETVTKSVSYNQLEHLYDNNNGTTGGFYSASETTAEVLFDLGKNHVIDHVVFFMKRKEKKHDISLIVGNLNNNQGGLKYVCERPDQSSEIYKCQPECRTFSVMRPGIIARKFIMRLLTGSNWISVYDMKVYASSLSISDDISINRLVLPSNCLSKSWLLTDKTKLSDMTIVATTTNTEIYFEKPYVITQIQVQLENTAPKTLNLQMINDRNKNNNVVLNLSECMLQNNLFTCNINSKLFASRRINVTSLGLVKIFIQGKPVFYPKLEIKTSTNTKEKLKMTCEYNPCDLSVHSDCSEDTIKSGVKFDCSNKRLLRLPSDSNTDSLVIVNNGKVESVWKSTNFSVDSDNEDSLSISMPRSFQYFGQYKCACIVADKMNTEIFSEVTKLKEVDFLEDLFFQTIIEYKISDSDDAPFYNTSKNIIYLSKTSIETSFVTLKISMLSLIPGNIVNISYDTENGKDHLAIERSTLHLVKAFDSISPSWNVATHKYILEEMFPDFNQNSRISIMSVNPVYNFTQNEYVIMMDEDKVKLKPAVWSTSDKKTTQVNIIYASKPETKLHYSETSCLTSNNSVLATFTNEQCTSSDSRLECTKLKDAYLLTFNDKTNFAKKIVLDLRTVNPEKSIEEITIKNNITLNQEDVILTPRYISVASSIKNKYINVVRIAVNVLSKKINDFIPCGKVLAKITASNKDTDMTVLQSSNFNFDVNMVTKEVNITLEITIDGGIGSHISHFVITDPTTFQVKKFQLQEDKTLNILWIGIDDIARDVLTSYELKISTTTLACNTTSHIVKSVNKSQTTGGKNRYQVALDPINQKHMILLSVTIQPVFIDNKRGQGQSLQKNFNTIQATVLSIASLERTTEQKLKVFPTQTGIECDIKEVQFNVTGINVEKFQWKAVPLSKIEYNIMNLIPGRKYEITAKVIYKHGPEDITSKLYTFETADEISIIRSTHAAQLNEKVNISCTAVIGPEDKFKKTVEWLRADKSSLPDGIKSELSISNPKVAFLIVEKALADHSGEYGCFARPSARVGAMTMSLVVNDLVVSPIEKQVDFNKKDEKVSVTCSSSAVRDTKIVWMDPLGVTIPEGDSEKYSIVRVRTDQNVDQATLTIKAPSLATSGTYNCHKSVGIMTVNMIFYIYGTEKLRIESLTMNSTSVGGKLRLRCIGEVGHQSQQVVWDNASGSEDLIKTSYPNPLDKTIQDIEIINSLSIHQVTCKLLPSLKQDMEPLSKTFQIKLKSQIVVKGPSEVNAGATVQLLCLGYPNIKNMKLEWMFFSKDMNAPGKVVKDSGEASTAKSHEPIRLVLNLNDVDEKKAGRYECKFKSEVRSVNAAPLSAKSISLVVNAVSNPVGVIDSQIKSKKSCPTSLMYSSVLVVVLTVLSMTVYPSW